MSRLVYEFLVICDPGCGQFNDVEVGGPKNAPKFSHEKCTRCNAPFPQEKLEAEEENYARSEFPR